MLAPKNNVSTIRTKVLTEVAKSFIDNDFTDVNSLPERIIPQENKPLRGSLEQDRLVAKIQCLSAMGFTPCECDLNVSLADMAAKALSRQTPEKATVSVMPKACNACTSTRLTVTEVCRACVARPCEVNCPKKAISVEDKAYIDQDLCIKCGICANNCPYGAINKAIVPCEDVCPVGAIFKDENGFEHIDNDKCISCGKCIRSCPFGAIVYNSQMIDVLKALKESPKKTVAMLAPAIVGQFGNDLGKVITALKMLGFDEVAEVAQGADVTTTNEAHEFIERMNEEAKFMTTSCCPAWVKAVEKHIPEISPYVSNTGSPMYYIAEIVKNKYPDCISVFIGPCLAKRLEAERNPNVDYVLVFEEIQAIFQASNINISQLKADNFEVEASAQGRKYPLSGGVGGAVAFVVGEKADCKLERIDGLSKENIKKLKQYTVKAPENCNMIEVMCCEGGCIAGPGTIAIPRQASVKVEDYVNKSKDIKR